MTPDDPAATPYPDLPGAGLPPRRTSVRTWWLLTVSSVALTAAVVIGTWATTQHRAPSRSAECVVVHARSAGEELRANQAPCSDDPSFTVVKRADPADNCGPGRYTQFRPPFADRATGRLCLVPNLVVSHCYRFGVPVGMWELGNCVGPATIRISLRVEADNPHACPVPQSAAPGMAQPAPVPLALAFPSRTYCYADVPDK